MAAAIVEIDSVQVIVKRTSIRVHEAIEERSTARFIVSDSTSAAKYVRGTPVTIDDNDGNEIFAGFINKPTRKRIAPGSGLYHSIICVDNHYLADKRIVARIWEGDPAGDIVTDIITDYLSAEGISAGTVSAGPTVTQLTANYVYVTDILDALAERAGFIWYIDTDLKLYFMDRTANVAPWALTTPYILGGTAELAEGNSEYRNRQWVRGGLVPTSEQTEEFSADGEQVAFACGFPLYSVPTITHDGGAALTVGIKGVDTGKDYYWNKGDNVVNADAVPGAGVVVKVVYYGMFKSIAQATNPADIVARAAIEGGTGYVDASLYDTNLKTVTATQERASSKITEYCREAEQFYFATRRAGLHAGQLLDVTYSPFVFTNHQMLITAIDVSFRGSYAVYEVTAVTGPVLGSWAKLFRTWVTEASNVIAIGEDSQVIILLQQNETVEVTESTSIDEDDFSGGEVNRWLNSAPIDAGSLYNVQHEMAEATEISVPSIYATEGYVWG